MDSRRTPSELMLLADEGIPDGEPTPSTIVEDDNERLDDLKEILMPHDVVLEGADPGQGGWMAVTRMVRQIDEEKVKNCKEDIDTLLVFAGLYSAVLSAFLIESYRLLIPDPQDEMVSLLRTIAAQNYTVTSSSVNSTTTTVEHPVFDAPRWAIRVNVLWFASIVLSLSSASIGILVKGWLREYLAMPYIAPLDRLRAREYRRPALEKWRVFEIAAILPLVLQIALGLFFIGLCYFSAAVHDSIRYATLPLVIGWACFFLLSTIAPLISPRCPYKTTFLVDFLRYTRATFRILRALCQPKKFRSPQNSHSASPANDAIFKATYTLRFRFAVRKALHRFENALRRLRDVAQQVQNRGEESAGVNEIVRIDGFLLSIDSQTPGNDVLRPMLELFNQEVSDPTGPKATTFLLTMLQHRFGKQQIPRPACGLTSFVKLQALSVQDWLAVVHFVAGNLKRYEPSFGEPWVTSSLLLLLSPANHPRPLAVSHVLAKYLYLIANESDVSLADRKACVLNYVLYFSGPYLEHRTHSGALPRAEDVTRRVPPSLHDPLTKTMVGILHSSLQASFASVSECLDWQLDTVQFLLSFGNPHRGLPATVAPTFHDKISLRESCILMCLYDISVIDFDSPDLYLSSYTRDFHDKKTDPSALVASTRQLLGTIYGPDTKATLRRLRQTGTWVAFQNVLFEAINSSPLAVFSAPLKTWQKDLLKLVFLHPFPASSNWRGSEVPRMILGWMRCPDALRVMLSVHSAFELPQSDDEVISVELARLVDAEVCSMVKKCNGAARSLFDDLRGETGDWGLWGDFIEKLADACTGMPRAA